MYFEPSVLVKLFKIEPESDRMIEIISRADEDRSWSAYTSSWSLLEIARALKKDGKPKEVIELNLRELRNHRISYKPVSQQILAEAERIVSHYNVYASDAVHAATYHHLQQKDPEKLAWFLTDDKHFRRLKEIVASKTIRDISLEDKGA